MSRETQKVDLDELTGGGSLGSPGGGGGPTMYRPTPPPTDETQVMKEQNNFKSEINAFKQKDLCNLMDTSML